MTKDLLLFGSPPPDGLVSKDRPVSIDVETTGLKWADRCLGVSVSWRGESDIQACYLMDTDGGQMPMFGYSGIRSSDIIVDLMATNPVVMHNHAFDYRVLMKEYGAPPAPNMLDTQHLAKQLEPQNAGLSLLALVIKYIKTPTIDPTWVDVKKQRANLGRLSPETTAEYGQGDVKYQLRLYEELIAKLEKKPHYKLLEWDQRFMRLVMELVERGLPVDREFCQRQARDFRTRAMAINMELVKVGITNPSYAGDVMGYANTRPGIHLGNTEMESLAQANDPMLKEVVKFRQLTKAVGSWLEPILEMSEGDGRLHARLDPFGTISYRMSSSDINAQGIPMEERGEREFGSMFGAFKSDVPGESIWALDLKQAEVRMAAVISGDQDLMRVLNAEGDPYAPLAISLWNDPKRRPDAKRALLSSIYEVGPASYSTKYGVTEERARTELDAIRIRFPTLRKRAIARRRFVEQMHYAPTCVGRPRWFTTEEVQNAAYKGFNQEIQGSVAEVMHESMLQVSDHFSNRMLLQVHDSIVMYLPDDPRERLPIVLKIGEIMDESVRALVDNQRKFNSLAFPVDAKPWQIMKGYD